MAEKLGDMIWLKRKKPSCIIYGGANFGPTINAKKEEVLIYQPLKRKISLKKIDRMIRADEP